MATTTSSSSLSTAPAEMMASRGMMNSSCGGSTTTIGGTATTADKLGVVMQGYLKKLKTMKKKYFVLLSECGDKSARLEYYDSEKKFRSRFGHPKRSIVLKSCFHISKRLDTKQKYVIALYTKDDSFCLVLDNECELAKWLKALLALHRIEDTEVDLPRTSFGELDYFFFFPFFDRIMCMLRDSDQFNIRTASIYYIASV